MIKDVLKKYYQEIIIITIFVSAQALANLALPDYMSKIITFGIAKLDLNYIVRNGILMLGIAIIGTIGSILASLYSSLLAARIDKNLRLDIYEKVINMDQENIDHFDSASLITRTANDVNQVKFFIGVFFRMLCMTLFLGIGGVIKAIEKSSGTSSLAIIIIIALLILVFLLVILFFTVVPRFEKVEIIIDKINAKTREILNGILVIRSLNKQKEEEKNFNNINKEMKKNMLFIDRVMSALEPMMGFILNTTSIAIIAVVSLQASNIAMVGNMIAFVQYATEIIMSFLMISMIFVFFPKASVAYKRIKEVLDTKNNIINYADRKTSIKKGHLEFKNVGFKYPDAKEEIIKNINFSSDIGMITAIVGGTASGKSTLISLIPRLYDVTCGEILIDEINIKHFPLSEIRQKVAFITQKPILFSGTLGENISGNVENLTDKEITASLEKAQGKEILEAKKKGLITLIAQGGNNLSGGQRSRVSIARGFIKNSPIIIFDDAFAALDYKTESAIRAYLEKLKKKTNIIIVSQRIASIKNADQIVVLEKGIIVGKGTHEELITNNQVYQEIAYSQLDKEEL